MQQSKVFKVHTDDSLLKAENFFGMSFIQTVQKPNSFIPPLNHIVLNQSLTLVKQQGVNVAVISNYIAIEKEGCIYIYNYEESQKTQFKIIMRLFQMIQPEKKTQERPIKFFKFDKFRDQIILLVVLGNNLAMYNLLDSNLLLDLPIYKTLINVKQIVWNEKYELVIVIGQNYHETFDVISILKVLGPLKDEKGFTLLENEQCRSFAISRSGIFQRYEQEDEVLFQRLVFLDQKKFEDTILFHDDFSSVSHADIFTKRGKPMLLLGCKQRKEFFIINFINLIKIQKYDLAPCALKYDSIQEVIPITGIAGYFPNVPFLSLSCSDEEPFVILTEEKYKAFYLVNDQLDLIFKKMEKID